METHELKKNKELNVLTGNINTHQFVKKEVTDHIEKLMDNRTCKNTDTITNENSNHFVINSRELPKGLTFSSLD